VPVTGQLAGSAIWQAASIYSMVALSSLDWLIRHGCLSLPSNLGAFRLYSHPTIHLKQQGKGCEGPQPTHEDVQLVRQEPVGG
jgi:hypothetical protein